MSGYGPGGSAWMCYEWQCGGGPSDCVIFLLGLIGLDFA